MAEVVAPLAGAWIEIHRIKRLRSRYEVAPLAGAWIEIGIYLSQRSLVHVAPLAGAWIEIPNGRLQEDGGSGRSPRGSVD